MMGSHVSESYVVSKNGHGARSLGENGHLVSDVAKVVVLSLSMLPTAHSRPQLRRRRAAMVARNLRSRTFASGPIPRGTG